jgi:hypothetical protein
MEAVDAGLRERKEDKKAVWSVIAAYATCDSLGNQGQIKQVQSSAPNF